MHSAKVHAYTCSQVQEAESPRSSPISLISPWSAAVRSADVHSGDSDSAVAHVKPFREASPQAEPASLTDVQRPDVFQSTLQAGPRGPPTGSEDSFFAEEPTVEAAPPTPVETVYLSDLLHDVYEYHGISALALHAWFWVVAILAVFFNWMEPDSIVRAQFQSALMSWGPSDWNQTSISNVGNMPDAVLYTTGFIANYISNVNVTEQRPLLGYRISEFSRATMARFVVDIDSSCDYSPPMTCYKNIPGAGLSSTKWQDLYSPFNAYGYGSFKYIDIFNQSMTGPDAAVVAMANLAEVVSDSAFLGQYALSVILEIMTVNHWTTSSVEGNSYSLFRIFATEKTTIWEKTLNPQFGMSTGTIMMKPSLLTSVWDFAAVGMWTILSVGVILYIMNGIDQFRRLRLQYGVARVYRDSCSSPSFAPLPFVAALYRYFSNTWNIADTVSHLGTLAACCTWWLFLLQSELVYDMKGFENDLRKMQDTIDFSERHIAFLYFCSLNNLILGLRIYQYMRAHAGLAVYYNMSNFAWKALKDFIFWFMYVLMLISVTVMAVFQISGTNPDFMTRALGISTMARVVFGFYNYDRFINEGAGMGGMVILAMFCFWFTVALLVVVAQNIILAIFNRAYEEAKASRGLVRASMVRIVLTRLPWQYCMYALQVWVPWSVERLLWLRFPSRKPHSMQWHFMAYIENQVQAYVEQRERKLDSVYKELKARWSIALIPEVRTMSEYFTDSGSLLTYERSPWKDPDLLDRIQRFKVVNQPGNVCPENVNVSELLPDAERSEGSDEPRRRVGQWTTRTLMTLAELKGVMLGQPLETYVRDKEGICWPCSCLGSTLRRQQLVAARSFGRFSVKHPSQPEDLDTCCHLTPFDPPSFGRMLSFRSLLGRRLPWFGREDADAVSEQLAEKEGGQHMYRFQRMDRLSWIVEMIFGVYGLEHRLNPENGQVYSAHKDAVAALDREDLEGMLKARVDKAVQEALQAQAAAIARQVAEQLLNQR